MALHALSPVDGRYADDTAALREYFSEFAYLRERVRIELDFLGALSRTGLIPAADLSRWEPDSREFAEADARKIQEHEQTTRHDVKAIEYFLRERIAPELHRWIHFGLTSEDVNNIAMALALRDSRDRVLVPALEGAIVALRDFAARYRATPLLARTHGQPAVPTTLGKEAAVYVVRLERCRHEMTSHRFEAKLTGAVGNFNALQSAAPQVDWPAFSAAFIRDLGLEPNLVTTQILPYDNWIRYFDCLRLTNTILVGYAQDMWRYVSDGVLKQQAIEGEIGSSTMPQKVNPIDFENAEGNLGIANALLTYYAQKLPVSRLQRDLSDSTVRRTFGVALGHTLLAWHNIPRGMQRVAANEEKLAMDLHAHWEIVGEGAQTILRAAGRGDAYESLKARLHGRILNAESYRLWVESLDVDDETREKLTGLSPEGYVGLAAQLVDSVIEGSKIVSRADPE